jgi:hypothetical protein
LKGAIEMKNYWAIPKQGQEAMLEYFKFVRLLNKQEKKGEQK